MLPIEGNQLIFLGVLTSKYPIKRNHTVRSVKEQNVF